MREPFEPLTPGARHVVNTNTYRMPPGMTEARMAEAIAEKIEFEGPDTVAAVILEPVQNAGGCFTPPDGYFDRVREICDENNVLLISDEVICAWGRLGEWFGCQRFDYQPDLITTAKGLTSSYAPMGAVIASDRVAEPFLRGTNSFTHGFTFGGHPVACRGGDGEPRRVRERGHPRERARQRGLLRRQARVAARSPDRRGRPRGSATSTRSSSSRTRRRRSPSTTTRPRCCCAGFLSGELFRRGLICRADDRGDPVIQLSPPLIAGPEQFDEIESILRSVLTEAGERMHVHDGHVQGYVERRGS